MRAVLVVVLLGTVPLPDPSSLMDRRWSVSVSLGTLGLEPDADGSDSGVTFGMLELAGRFRIRSFVDVGLSLHGGGAGEGDLSTAGATSTGTIGSSPTGRGILWALLFASVAAEDQSDEAKQGRGFARGRSTPRCA